MVLYYYYLLLAQLTLQPSTAIANQLHGQLVSTEISYIARTIIL